MQSFFVSMALLTSACVAFQLTTPSSRIAGRIGHHSSTKIERHLSTTRRMAGTQSYDVQSPRIRNFRDIEKEIVQLGRSGKTDEALSIYVDVEQPTVRLMNSAIDACSRARPTRLDQAFAIFESGVKEYGISPNVFTFGALMNACNRDRNSSRALSLLKSMKVSKSS